MDTTSPLARREKESAEAHRALLLWAMCAPDKRSQTALSKVTGVGESSIRHHRKVQEWDARLKAAGDRAGEQAVQLHRELYEKRYGVQAVRALRDHYHYLAAAYPLPGAPTADPPPEVTPPPPRTGDDRKREAEEAKQIQEDAKAALKDRRLMSILDAAEIRLVQGIAKGSVRVSLADLDRIVKLRTYLEKRSAPAIVNDSGKDPRESVAKSERVLHAIANGGDVLAAVVEDLDEIRLIATVMHDHEAQVLQFPAQREDARKE